MSLSLKFYSLVLFLVFRFYTWSRSIPSANLRLQRKLDTMDYELQMRSWLTEPVDSDSDDDDDDDDEVRCLSPPASLQSPHRNSLSCL